MTSTSKRPRRTAASGRGANRGAPLSAAQFWADRAQYDIDDFEFLSADEEFDPSYRISAAAAQLTRRRGSYTPKYSSKSWAWGGKSNWASSWYSATSSTASAMRAVHRAASGFVRNNAINTLSIFSNKAERNESHSDTHLQVRIDAGLYEALGISQAQQHYTVDAIAQVLALQALPHQGYRVVNQLQNLPNGMASVIREVITEIIRQRGLALLLQEMPGWSGRIEAFRQAMAMAEPSDPDDRLALLMHAIWRPQDSTAELDLAIALIEEVDEGLCVDAPQNQRIREITEAITRFVSNYEAIGLIVSRAGAIEEDAKVLRSGFIERCEQRISDSDSIRQFATSDPSDRWLADLNVINAALERHYQIKPMPSMPQRFWPADDTAIEPLLELLSSEQKQRFTAFRCARRLTGYPAEDGTVSSGCESYVTHLQALVQQRTNDKEQTKRTKALERATARRDELQDIANELSAKGKSLDQRLSDNKRLVVDQFLALSDAQRQELADRSGCSLSYINMQCDKAVPFNCKISNRGPKAKGKRHYRVIDEEHLPCNHQFAYSDQYPDGHPMARLYRSPIDGRAIDAATLLQESPILRDLLREQQDLAAQFADTRNATLELEPRLKRAAKRVDLLEAEQSAEPICNALKSIENAMHQLLRDSQEEQQNLLNAMTCNISRPGAQAQGDGTGEADGDDLTVDGQGQHGEPGEKQQRDPTRELSAHHKELNFSALIANEELPQIGIDRDQHDNLAVHVFDLTTGTRLDKSIYGFIEQS